MQVVGVIPARYGSTRLKGKVLLDLCGKPLIQHVWEGASKAKTLDIVLIATDDEKVKQVCEGFGAKVVLTSPACQSGSDRISQAVKNIPAAIVLNIQGDEPLMSPSAIDDLVKGILNEKDAPVATLVRKITKKKDIESPSVVKAVIDNKGFALYFSRATIPFDRDQRSKKPKVYYKHLGIYAYRKSFLMDFNNLPASKLEQTEKLEQLRILEAGYKIKVIETDQDSIGVDTKEDLLKVKRILEAKDG